MILRRLNVLNEMQQFHVAVGLPSDVTHDLFEEFYFELLEKPNEHCLKLKYFTFEM